jgi:Zn-dependent M28 family amino/carboxypeptidase
MLVRIAGAVGLQVVSVIVVAAIVKSVDGASLSARVWLALEAAVVVSSVPTLFFFVRGDSRGAVDNATGVVAALLAASHTTSPRDLGVLITSGEELGLAGARAWAATAPAGITVLNCDTVDDVGGWRCMYSGSAPTAITSIATRVGHSVGLSVRAGRLIPGILADNIAFADVRIDSVTISRGNFSTLARIHTRRDTSIALTGQGVAECGVLLSALARELG